MMRETMVSRSIIFEIALRTRGSRSGFASIGLPSVVVTNGEFFSRPESMCR